MEEKQLSIFDSDQIELVEKDGLYSLTDIWRKSGKEESAKPINWIRFSGADFIEFVKQNFKGDINTPFILTTKGRNGQTFAHWQIALAYAKYLSPELHAKVNQIFKERLEEDKNPELGINRSRQRAIENWRNQGKNEKWIQNRLSGIDTRKHFTDTLSDHGCDGYGIGWSTNEIYKSTIGGTAKQVKSSKGLSSKDNLRDHLSMTENAANLLAESLACDKIESDKLSGNHDCAMASKKAGNEVKKAIDNVLKPQIER